MEEVLAEAGYGSIAVEEQVDELVQVKAVRSVSGAAQQRVEEGEVEVVHERVHVDEVFVASTLHREDTVHLHTHIQRHTHINNNNKAF